MEASGRCWRCRDGCGCCCRRPARHLGSSCGCACGLRARFAGGGRTRGHRRGDRTLRDYPLARRPNCWRQGLGRLNCIGRHLVADRALNCCKPVAAAPGNKWERDTRAGHFGLLGTAFPKREHSPNSISVSATCKRNTWTVNGGRSLQARAAYATGSTFGPTGSRGRRPGRRWCHRSGRPRAGPRGPQSPVVRALPLPGLPLLLSFQQSSVHSQTLPCNCKGPTSSARSYRPARSSITPRQANYDGVH